jgi:Kef-type K+ transport system membrane component KefB
MDAWHTVPGVASTLAPFVVALVVVGVVPLLCRRFGLPQAVLLLLAGVLLGPHGLGVFAAQRPVADFFAELGKLLLMFMAGLRIDLGQLYELRRRCAGFGLMTTLLPLALGTGVALALGYGWLPAVVVGALIASHTLIGMPIVMRLGATKLEPVVVAVGSTLLSDALALLVLAACVSAFAGGFSWAQLTLQALGIVLFVPLLLLGLGWLAQRLLRAAGDDEAIQFVLLLLALAVAALLAQAVHLPDIVGAFLAGLAVNAAARGRPATAMLEGVAHALFIPAFFFVTGFIVDPLLFVQSAQQHLPIAAGITAALLLGKWLAAQLAGRAFGYSADARLTVWSLTMPQIAATLAAALVAFQTRDAAGQRLLDQDMLHAVLVMLVVSSIIGLLLTQRYAPRLLREPSLDR